MNIDKWLRVRDIDDRWEIIANSDEGEHAMTAADLGADAVRIFAERNIREGIADFRSEIANASASEAIRIRHLLKPLVALLIETEDLALQRADRMED